MRALVKNAADEQQVKRGGAKDRNRRDQELADLRAVLSSAAGRRVLWRLLVHAGIKDSIFASDALHMAALVGQREHALWLEAEITEADDEAMSTIRLEAARLARTERQEIDAAHAAPAEEETEL